MNSKLNIETVRMKAIRREQISFIFFQVQLKIY